MSTTPGICGSGNTSPSTAIPSGISVHSVETHSVFISEAIDFEVTLHFSVGTHRDSNEPPLYVAFMSGFIQRRMWRVDYCGWGLAWYAWWALVPSS